ncbi:MAG: 2-oxoacid:acceptor oxidoreductase family protein, partial [Candidatus Binatia bacterium]|nr:2-oxoacid:acceptor oxidoreductase family protein [Candidatus Binatia bacterium]
MASEKHEVIFAGMGGMGALTAGQLLAQAAFSSYSHVTWYPNITTARRNAPADCIVIFSQEPIASPLIYQVETVVAIESSQMKNFEQRVKSGGFLLVETAGMKEDPQREDIRVIKIDGVGTALREGSTRGAN